jgi:hypothetical protein
MSKAVAWIHPDHLDNADMDILVKFMANSKRTESCSAPLYTTDHAEELAKALDKVRTMLFHLPLSSLNEDVLEILGYIDDKVFNYREATK